MRVILFFFRFSLSCLPTHFYSLFLLKAQNNPLRLSSIWALFSTLYPQFPLIYIYIFDYNADCSAFACRIGADFPGWQYSICMFVCIVSYMPAHISHECNINFLLQTRCCCAVAQREFFSWEKKIFRELNVCVFLLPNSQKRMENDTFAYFVYLFPSKFEFGVENVYFCMTQEQQQRKKKKLSHTWSPPNAEMPKCDDVTWTNQAFEKMNSIFWVAPSHQLHPEVIWYSIQNAGE